MIAIYRGEDTCFAGAEPFQIKLDTELDLTGYTAELYFGSIVKFFGSDEVEKKVLRLSYTADETSSFFPGRGFATVKVYDTEGRVAVLKKFVIDVRFRKCDNAPVDAIDVAESVQEFLNVRKAAEKMFLLNEEDDIAAIKEAVNTILSAARERTEFSPVTMCQLGEINPKSIAIFKECMTNLQSLSLNLESLDEDSDTSEVKEAINAIVSVLGSIGVGSIGNIDFSGIEDPAASVNSIRIWAMKINGLLKKLNIK